MSSNPTCKQCNKVVYQAELVTYDKQTWHKNCFRCLQCKNVVSLGGVAMINSDLYCKNCFKRIFKEKGTYNSFNDRRPGGAGAVGGPAESAHPVKNFVGGAHTVSVPRRASIGKCAVAECSILRAAGKIYCARHSNQMRDVSEPSPPSSDAAAAAAVVAASVLHSEVIAESPRTSAAVAQPSAASRSPSLRQLPPDITQAFSSSLARASSKPQLLQSESSLALSSFAAALMQSESSLNNRLSARSHLSSGRENARSPLDPSFAAAAAATRAGGASDIARSSSDLHVGGSPYGRQASLRALYGLQTQSLRSPRDGVHQGVQNASSRAASPLDNSNSVVAELSAQVKV